MLNVSPAVPFVHQQIAAVNADPVVRLEIAEWDVVTGFDVPTDEAMNAHYDELCAAEQELHDAYVELGIAA